MRPVILESPYQGNVSRNVTYARACVAHAIGQGDAPFAGHLLYTQPGILTDLKPEERELGIECGFAWGDLAQAAVVYVDLGYSSGMKKGIARWQAKGLPVEERSIAGWRWDEGLIDVIRGGMESSVGVLNGIAKAPDEHLRMGLIMMLVGLLEASKLDVLRLLTEKS